MSDHEDSVCYWRMCLPQVSPSECVDDLDSDDGEEYEILHPSPSSKVILEESAFNEKWMPKVNSEGESLYHASASIATKIISLLIYRFTNYKSNWETKTLRSFLEVTCWISVTYGGYMLYGDLISAIRLGTFVGMMVSVCDEFLWEFGGATLSLLRRQPWGPRLLETLGFQFNRKVCTTSSYEDLTLLKTVLFGYLGVAVIYYILDNIRDIKEMSLLTAAAGVMFVTAGEIFSMWHPTHRIGLTIQGRWTRIGDNWKNHTRRSFIEVSSWLLAVWGMYIMSMNLAWSIQVGTLVGVVVCLFSGLDDFHSDAETRHLKQYPIYPFCDENMLGTSLIRMAKCVVDVQKTVKVLDAKLAAKAKRIMEDFSE